MKYNKIVERHFFAPKNILNVDQDINGLSKTSLGSKDLGDAMDIFISCDKGTDSINSLYYNVYGNPYLIASLSYIAEKISGLTIDEALEISSETLITDLEIPQTKHYCAYMVEDALKKSIKTYREQYV